MCGILLEIICGNWEHPCCKNQKLQHRLQSRGPDIKSELSTIFDGYAFNDFNGSSHTTPDGVQLHFIGHVLQTQGVALIPQPLVYEHGVLLFNGDIYNYNEENCDNDSDSNYLLDKFKSYKETERDQRERFILSVIRQLQGPFCIIYLDKILSKIFFTRDQIGRHSLLINLNEQILVISSVLDRSHNGYTVEIPAEHIFSINLSDLSFSAHDWESSITSKTFSSFKDYMSLRLESSFNSEDKLLDFSPSKQDLLLIETINRIADGSLHNKDFMSSLLKLTEVRKVVDKIIELLSNSVRLRVNSQPFLCKQCKDHLCERNKHSTVSILFSGGLDCTLLAVFAAKTLPQIQPIDLLNVAFENKHLKNYNVPDRLTAKQTFRELQLLFPERIWNLVEINVSKDELNKYQNEIIADLVFPLQSILDESLGSALWFAARGRSESYASQSRIILMGSGADELFGGYNRHRMCFKRRGWTGLGSELNIDWNRISHRNLARDSRVIGDHGRQARFPYLDEAFLQYVLQLKPWQRCIPSDSCKRGWGDKLFLRLAAYRMGLEEASTLEKRAIQFGSRIANKNENAKDISPRLLINSE